MERSEVGQGGEVSAERLVGGGKQIKKVDRTAKKNHHAIQEEAAVIGV